MPIGCCRALVGLSLNSFRCSIRASTTLRSAENMSTDWLGPRIYRPSLEEVLLGAISPHHRKFITLPTSAILVGGFVSYLKNFVPLGDLKLNHELVSIDPRTRQLRFPNGFEALRRPDLFNSPCRISFV